jgi:hypothetical protein
MDIQILNTLLLTVAIAVPVLLARNIRIMWMARKASNSGVITERLITSASLLAVYLFIVGRTILRLTGDVPASEATAAITTLVSLLCLAIPSIVWEWMYRTGRLDR